MPNAPANAGSQALTPQAVSPAARLGPADGFESALSGGALARSAFWNFLGQGFLLVVGLASLPFIVHSLGPERFGIFSLALAALGFLTVFDLGVGQAVTKFVADAFGRGEAWHSRTYLWNGVALQGAVGALGAGVLVILTPYLIGPWIPVSLAYAHDARSAFLWTAATLPLTLLSSSFAGVLAGAQRFGLLNAGRVASGTASYLLPVAVLAFRGGLAHVMAALFVARLAYMAAVAWAAVRVIPASGAGPSPRPGFRPLLAFGLWVAAITVVGGTITYADRFAIGALRSPIALAFYVVPLEAVARLSLIPMSLAAVLFPAFSAWKSRNQSERMSMFLARSLKYTILVVGPIAVFLSVFSKDILRVWLGDEFARRSATVLAAVAIGVLMNSLSFFPYALLQGVGRPDVIAYTYAVELLIYAGLLAWLVARYGIVGAAWAWTARVALDAGLVLFAAHRVAKLPARELVGYGVLGAMFALAVFAAAAVIAAAELQGAGVGARLATHAVLWALFAAFGWRFLLDDVDRSLPQRLWNVRARATG